MPKVKMVNFKVLISSVRAPVQTSQFLVGSIYRHLSSNWVNFIEAFSDSLAPLFASNIKLFVRGNLNIDISQTNETSAASNYLNMIESHGLLPLITKPTRVNETISTILNYILTNDVHHCILPGIIEYGLSDHYPILCTVFDPSSFQVLYKSLRKS